MNTLLLCLIVFFVRIVDTSLNTIRTILTVRNKKIVAVLISFFEVLIWFLIVKESIKSNTNSIWIAISYSAGYAVGVLLGMSITNKFMVTNVCVDVIIVEDCLHLLKELDFLNYSFYITNILDKYGNNIIKLIIYANSKKINEIKKVIYKHSSQANINIFETKAINLLK